MKRLATAALFVALLPTSAPAIAVELARKCDAALANAFPARIPGNPATGSARGSGREEIAFYKQCVANAGNPSSKPSVSK